MIDLMDQEKKKKTHVNSILHGSVQDSRSQAGTQDLPLGMKRECWVVAGNAAEELAGEMGL